MPGGTSSVVLGQVSSSGQRSSCQTLRISFLGFVMRRASVVVAQLLKQHFSSRKAFYLPAVGS
eukprot:11182190-Lingulodinium_polyedra.AAC.1